MIPQQEFECRQFAPDGATLGHEKDFRIPSVFKLPIMEERRLKIIRLSYTGQTAMEILRGPGAPEWDALGTVETDMWAERALTSGLGRRAPHPHPPQPYDLRSTGTGTYWITVLRARFARQESLKVKGFLR